MVVNDEQRGFAVAPVSVAELQDLTLARTALKSIMLPMAIAQGDADGEAEILAAFHRLSRTPLPLDPAALADASLWEMRHRAFHQALVAGCGESSRPMRGRRPTTWSSTCISTAWTT